MGRPRQRRGKAKAISYSSSARRDRAPAHSKRQGASRWTRSELLALTQVVAAAVQVGITVGPSTPPPTQVFVTPCPYTAHSTKDMLPTAAPPFSKWVRDHQFSGVTYRWVDSAGPTSILARWGIRINGETVPGWTIEITQKPYLAALSGHRAESLHVTPPSLPEMLGARASESSGDGILRLVTDRSITVAADDEVLLRIADSLRRSSALLISAGALAVDVVVDGRPFLLVRESDLPTPKSRLEAAWNVELAGIAFALIPTDNRGSPPRHSFPALTGSQNGPRTTVSD